MRILVWCLLLPLLVVPDTARASGYARSFPTFGLTLRPDLPLENFAAGRLGVIRPSSWAVSYLVVAYRHLAGLPPSAAEQKVFLSVWESRLSAGQGYAIAQKLDIDRSLRYWLKTRGTVSAPGVEEAGEVRPWKNAQTGYFQFLNCTAGAFDKAAETLEERIERFGAASLQTRSWLAAQDVVFENCSGAVPERLPPAALPDEDPLIRFDRSYQIAAAHFYAGNHDAAASAFEAVAADAASPWRFWARLALARILIRRADLGEVEGAERPALVSRASKDLIAMIADESLAEVHGAARSLLHTVCARQHDPTAAAFLAEVILHPPGMEELAWAFDSYTLGHYSRPVPDPSTAKDDMARWIGAVASGYDRTFALARWREGGALHWFVAALTTARPGDPSLPDLLPTAAKVPLRSPAWPTVTYHRLRLEPSAGSARRELEVLLPKLERSLPATSYNLFVALRYSLAADLDELLRHAPRVPVAILSSEYRGGDETAEGPLFDKDAADTFNMRVPLAVLAEAVNRPILPRRLRNELARTAWVRAVLLEDHATARRVAELLRSLPGAAAPYGLSKDLQAYLGAKSPTERNLAAALALGRNPGLSPWIRDGFMRKGLPEELGNAYTNWWFNERYSQWLGGRDLAASPNFLRPEERAEAEAEYRKLLSLGNGPTYIARVAVAAAEALPGHPAVPEMLHRAVVASGTGWGDAETGRWSKAAFTMLHSRYPASTWTNKTPYWYR